MGITPSVGSVGDSYDNALAETIIGLYKTEVIRRRGPWRYIEAVEFATLEWVDCSIIGACWNRSETCPRPRKKNCIINITRSRPSQPDSN